MVVSATLQAGLTWLSTAQKPAHSPAANPAQDIPSVATLDRPHFWRALGLDFQSDLLTFLHRDLPKILFVVLFTWLLILVVRFFSRKLRTWGGVQSNSARGAQLKTVASVFNAAAYGLLIFHAIIEILQIFNINVTPLLASAGVAGVAVGFGAQTIVKDVINGILMLFENQFNVGDLITVASLTGFVEDISLRKVTMRDGDTGAVYIVPNSQITTVANRTRDLGKVIVNIPVDNVEDPDKVIAILKRVANEVAAEPEFAKVLRQPPEIIGVDKVDATSMTFPVVFTAGVNQQWGVSREFRRRVLLEFRKAGIQIVGASRVVNMALPDGSAAATAQAPAAAQGGGNSGSPGNTSQALDQTAGTKPA